MKIKTTISSLIIALVLVGCTAQYGNIKQYEDGNWWLWASSSEVSRIKSDKLAIEKLQQTPVINGTGQNLGYLGYIKNYTNEIVDIKVYGPETKSWHFSNSGEVTDYLIPGKYKCLVTCKGRVVVDTTFSVGPQLKDFDNKKCHWYAYASYNY